MRTLRHDAFPGFFDAAPDGLWEVSSLPDVRSSGADTKSVYQAETVVEFERGFYCHNEPQLSSECPAAVGREAGARIHSDEPWTNDPVTLLAFVDEVGIWMTPKEKV